MSEHPLDDLIQQQRDDLATLDDAAAVDLRLRYATEADAVLRDVLLVTRDIDAARSQGVTVDADWLRRQPSSRRLDQRLTTMRTRFTTDGATVLDQLATDADRQASRHARKRLDLAGVETSTVPPPATRLSASDPTSPQHATLDSYGEHTRAVVTTGLEEGIAAGHPGPEIARGVRQQLKASTAPRLDALARTELMQTYRDGMFRAYAAAGVETWVWHTARASRPCLACLAMDQREFPMSDAFMKAHVACRCSPLPGPLDRYGDVPESASAWFDGLPPAEQRRMLPSQEAFEAYQRGDVLLADFVGTRTGAKGEHVYQRSGRDALAVAAARKRNARIDASRDEFLAGDMPGPFGPQSGWTRQIGILRRDVANGSLSLDEAVIARAGAPFREALVSDLDREFPGYRQKIIGPRFREEMIVAEGDARAIRQQIDDIDSGRTPLPKQVNRLVHRNNLRRQLEQAEQVWQEARTNFLACEPFINDSTIRTPTQLDHLRIFRRRLNEIRDVGSGGTGVQGQRNLVDALDANADLFPKSWWDRLRHQVRQAPAASPWTVEEEDRGFFNAGGLIVLSRSNDQQHLRRVSLHELTHAMEYVVPGLSQAEETFYNRRTKGEQLKMAPPSSRQTQPEYWRPDKFYSPYVGRDYGGNDHYEIATMGIQAIATPYGRLLPLHLIDEDHADFILGLWSLLDG